MTSRSKLKQPTSLRPPSGAHGGGLTSRQTASSRQKFDSEQQHDFKPKINRNTEKMVQNRQKRIEQQNSGNRNSK